MQTLPESEEEVSKLRWIVDYVYEHVQDGPMIYGPGNRTIAVRREVRRLQQRVNGEWVDVPEEMSLGAQYDGTELEDR